VNANDYGVLSVGWAEWGGRGGDGEENDEASGEQAESRGNVLHEHELSGGNNEASTGGDWSQTSGKA
jgi:hypothetical protein